MRLSQWLRRNWPETLLFTAVALPWLSLFALGFVWLWQGGRVWAWAIAAALGLLAWPLSISVKRRANEEARLALGDLAAPSRGWNVSERDAWVEVLAIADATAPFSFTEMEPLITSARDIVEIVARHFHPEARTAWARFGLPDFLLLTERLSRDVRREALRHIPAVRAMKLSHLLWVHRQHERYGAAAQAGWHMGFGLWRVIRAALNPIQAAGQETSGLFLDKTARVLSYRLRAYFTRLLVLEIGRASIDLYSGRLALSDEDLSAAGRDGMYNGSSSIEQRFAASPEVLSSARVACGPLGAPAAPAVVFGAAAPQLLAQHFLAQRQGPATVLARKDLCAIGVAHLDRLEESAVLLQRIGGAPGLVKGAGLHLAHVIEQALQRLQQTIVVGGAAYELMKYAAEPAQCTEIATAANDLHIVEQFADLRDLRGRSIFRGKPRRHAFERFSHVEQLGQVVLAEFAYDETRAGMCDEPFDFELA
jgi:hypothetical protein